METQRKYTTTLFISFFIFLFNLNFSILPEIFDGSTDIIDYFYQPASAQNNLPELVEQTLPATGMIYIYDQSDKLTGFGSGFFISQNYDFITNRHVLENVCHAEVKSCDGEIFPVLAVIGENKKNDLIRLKTAPLSRKAAHLQVSPHLPKLGEHILVIGNPLGYMETISDGIVSSIRKIPAAGTVIQISAPISRGSSGSPVINMEGDVIGVVSFMVDGPNLNFAVPGSQILNMTIFEPVPLIYWAENYKQEWLSSAKGLNVTGETLLHDHRFSEAATFFKRALQKSPNFSRAHFNLGNCQRELRNYEAAAKSYLNAIKYKKDHLQAYLNLAAVYNKQQQYDKAIKILNYVIELNPNIAEVYGNLGSVYYNVNNYHEAAKTLKKAIELKPNYEKAYYKLGLCYCRLNDFKKAIKNFQISVILNPKNMQAYNNLFTLFLNNNRVYEAFDIYKQVAIIDLNFAKTNLNLNLLNQKLKEQELMTGHIADYASLENWEQENK